MKTKTELTAAGFTASGAKRYDDTVNAYAEELFKKSLLYGEAEKASDSSIEVGHDHVRSAAHTIASGFGKDRPSRGENALKIAEYLFTAIAGVGGGNLKDSWGIAFFVGGVALGVICYVARNNLRK